MVALAVLSGGLAVALRPAPEETVEAKYCGRATELVVGHGFSRAIAGLKACATTGAAQAESPLLRQELGRLSRFSSGCTAFFHSLVK